MSATEKPILCRTRTGKKVHLAYAGSSVTNCGHWLRVSASAMAFPRKPVLDALARGEEIANPSSLGPSSLILCEHCFSERARTVSYVTEMTGTVEEAKAAYEADRAGRA